MRPRATIHPALALALAALACAPGGCAGRGRPAPTTLRWVVGGVEPRFDPHGPPHAIRQALERWLSFGLLAEDSAGVLRPAAAGAWSASPDSLIWTFRLRPDLRFTDGTPCRSEDFRRALTAGLARADHATERWLLGAVTGMDAVRAGRPLPRLGIEASGPNTLVIRLARTDARWPRALALPGIGVPWRHPPDSARWDRAVGLGPYRVVGAAPGRSLTLARTVAVAGPDTVEVRFAPGAPRVRALLRAGRAALVWPLPPTLLDQPLPGGARFRLARARPERHLLLVMRADLPPTSRPAARAAIAHGLSRAAARRALGARGEPVAEWPSRAGRFDFPAYDDAAVRGWMERGRLGRSFHVEMGFDADGAGALVARPLQTEWARVGIDVGLVPLHGEQAVARALVRGPHLFLIESQPPLEGTAAELATLVLPMRGPAVGAFRTGWRTREFDPWIDPAAPRRSLPLVPEAVRRRLEEERVALPLARLPWTWVEGGPLPAAVRPHPRFGPAFLSPTPGPADAVLR